MTTNDYALKGDLVFSASPRELVCAEDSYLVCENGQSAGIFEELPERYRGINVHDYSGQLIIPGLVDLHTHAPQFAYRGMGMDLELLDWLTTYTFPEEARYQEVDYARRNYASFVEVLRCGATTRAAIFATTHVEATLLLMDMLEESGLATLVGKVNMDRNSTADLAESDAEASLQATRQWICASRERGYVHTAPILTPRFIPSCTDELMRGLSALQDEFDLPAQSHLSENPSEIAWVAELCPDSSSYADAYYRRGMLGGEGRPTIMAHCVYSDPSESPLLKQQGVWIAHCPESNTCLGSGIAPVRAYLEQGQRIGLGTDVAGGFSPSMLHTVAETIKVSKLRWRLVDNSLAPLTFAEAFYLATRGGGSFWGKVGSFEAGFEFDAVVLADTGLSGAGDLDAAAKLEARLERAVYADKNDTVRAKYVAGQRLF